MKGAGFWAVRSAELGMDEISQILGSESLPDLGPVARADALSVPEIEKQINELGSKISGTKLRLLKAALLLWNDHLDESHTIAQEIENADGSMLHAIMHRREPDYFNSKYWWRRVGQHPSFEGLGKEAGKILDAGKKADLKAKLLPRGNWDPYAFVDAVEQALAKKDLKRSETLKEIQKAEMEAFLLNLQES
jgi:hypothetical protein